MKIDVYVWKARRCPVLLTVLPPALAVLAWFPTADWKLVLPVLTFFGLFALLSQVGRDRGKNMEAALFEEWGGKPTSVLLRHRDTPFDEVTLARLHRWLATVTGVPTPSKRKETGSPAEADEVYEAYTRHLRDVTRDRDKVPLVFDENVSYGFRRNLCGLRPFGIALSLAAVVACVWKVVLSGGAGESALAVCGAVVSGLLLLMWLFWFRRGWVRIPARAYAERLLEAGLRLATADEAKPAESAASTST
jgi:hypothetical protein